MKMTRLSCHRFRSNEVRLWLSLIAYNLGNLCRRPADQTRPVLLADAGREPSHAAAVREHGEADRCAGHRVGYGREASRAKEGSGRIGV